MDLNAWFTNGPKPGRLKNISIPCGPKSVANVERKGLSGFRVAGVRPLDKAHVRSSYRI